MASTTIGGVPLIDPNQQGKAATADAAFQAIDNMINGSLTVNAATNPAPYTIPYQTGDEPAVTKTALRFVYLTITGALSANWSAIMPNDGSQRLFILQNATTGGHSVTIGCSGQPGTTIPNGQTFLCFLTGTDVIQVPITLAAGTQPFDIGNFLVGSPTAGQTIMRFIVARTVTFPANFALNQMKSNVTAAGTAVFTLNKNGSSVGTATFSGGGTTPVWASSGGAPVTFAVGDVGTFVAPSPADANLADLEWTFTGTR